MVVLSIETRRQMGDQVWRCRRWWESKLGHVKFECLLVNWGNEIYQPGSQEKDLGWR